MRRLVCTYVCLCVSGIMVSCGAQKDLAAADTAVANFHRLLNDQDYITMYTQADQKFRDATKQADFVALMNAVHKKLGPVSNTSRKGFFVNYNSSGSQIRVNYATRFSDADAQEQFVWVKKSDNLALLGYNITSNALIVR